MRKNTRSLVEIAARHLDLPEPIVEFGSYQVTPGAISDLRPIFGARAYVGTDVRPGPGVDRVENLESLTFAGGSVGTAVLLDTLEHVQDPPQAMGEIFRALQPGGIAIATSVMDLFIHNEPDYWRFTPAAFKYLFRQFGETMVGYQGNPEKPHTVFAVGIREPAHSHAAHSHAEQFAAIEAEYRRTNRSWYWRVAQPYYAARDLASIVRRNNAMGFEVVSGA